MYWPCVCEDALVCCLGETKGDTARVAKGADADEAGLTSKERILVSMSSSREPPGVVGVGCSIFVPNCSNRS
jgi:hypothetical protein